MTDRIRGECEIYKNSKRKWIEDMNGRVYGRIILRYMCKTDVMELVRSS